MTATNTACEGRVPIELSAWATKISPKNNLLKANARATCALSVLQ